MNHRRVSRDGTEHQPEETKNYSWFSDEQLAAHLDGLYMESVDAKVLLALGSFESGAERAQFDPIAKLCARKGIQFQALSFEEFYDTLPREQASSRLKDMLDEFRTYLDGEGLLPSWRDKLDVVNCAGLPDDVLVHHVYMCPAASGAYSHRRCQYFGMYAGNKTVEHIALIRAVVDVLDPAQAVLLWKNTDESTAVLEAEAITKVSEARKEWPTRVFLLRDLHPTRFVKDTRGGLQGSKVYFDVAALKANDAREVAEKLTDKPWSAVPAWS